MQFRNERKSYCQIQRVIFFIPDSENKFAYFSKSSILYYISYVGIMNEAKTYRYAT